MLEIPPGTLAFGTQLPIQTQTTLLAGPWEAEATPADLMAIARAADRSGFHNIAVCDHVAIPRDKADAMSLWWQDTFTTLGWLAAGTERVALMTHVYVLAYRHALVAAKAFATLDHLSGGRAIIGIGVGHVEAEFDALGVSFADRGRITDERLPELAEALEHTYVGDLGALPRPVQSPRPPIWIGGSGAPAVRRAARWDGWLPQGPATSEAIDTIRRLRDDAGTADRPLRDRARGRLVAARRRRHPRGAPDLVRRLPRAAGRVDPGPDPRGREPGAGALRRAVGRRLRRAGRGLRHPGRPAPPALTPAPHPGPAPDTRTLRRRV